jgi:tetratricopeptide (TPR) repeat protein
MGEAEWMKTGNSRASIPFYRHATELDPNFAFAFAVLGGMDANVGDMAGYKEATEKAYALRDRVSERERLFIELQDYRIHGDGKKVRETLELLAREYPRDGMFRGLLAEDYVNAGEPEKALPEAQASIRDSPGIMKGYAFEILALEDLNRLDEAKATLQKAIANGFDTPVAHFQLLRLAYAQGDVQTQQRETQWFESHQGDAVALALKADNVAALGHSRQAADLYRRGVDSARQHPSEITPQLILAKAATTDALFGKCAPHAARGVPPIVTALCDAAAAKKFAAQLSARRPVPNAGAEAYVRGLALLADGQAPEAAGVFSLMVDRKGANWGPEYPAAQVGLARAAKQMGDSPRARKTYEQFFTFWKDADPDIPLLLEARKEYAALK